MEWSIAENTKFLIVWHAKTTVRSRLKNIQLNHSAVELVVESSNVICDSCVKRESIANEQETINTESENVSAMWWWIKKEKNKKKRIKIKIDFWRVLIEVLHQQRQKPLFNPL